MSLKRKISLVMLLSIMMCFFGSTSTTAQDNNIAIVCTNSALADFTSHLVTDNVTIEYIMPAGACPAHFDTCPSDVSLIASADIIISLGWEPWLASLVNSSGNTAVQQIACAQLGEWNIPSGAIAHVQTIREGLIDLLPERNATIQENAQQYLAEINTTASYIQQVVSDNGSFGKNVICMQWHQDFLEWAGFNVTYAYGPPEGLSVQDELDVINAASNGDICAVIDNLQSGTDFGARVASETGASHVIFTNFPGAIPNTDTYEDMIVYNVKQLIEGISTYEYKQGDITQLEAQLTELELQRNLSLAGAAMLGVLAILFAILYRRK